MQINNLSPRIESVYYEHNFLVMLESHLTYLRQDTNVSIRKITNHQGLKYEGDLFGLLDDLNIKKKYHLIVARINGYHSGADYKGNIDYIVIPNFEEIELLKNQYMTKNF